MDSLGALLDRQLHYVCGKGGVGKSVVAVSLARALHRRGRRVLLVQVNAPDTHSALLGTSPIGAETREIEPGFFVVDSTSAAAMKEYALMTLKFESLYRAVFENRLTKVFLRFVPSLNELTIQGKIWFHAEERDGNRPRFDHIVVDCPSTGHGLKFLRVARIVGDASRVGPMADKTKLMATVVEDPARTALHVVALPEELPVNEARDLVHQVRSTKAAPLGAVFFNQRLQRLFDDDTERDLGVVDGARPSAHPGARTSPPAEAHAVDQLLDVASRRRQREHLEREMRAKIEELALPVVELPLVLVPALGKTEIEGFAKLIESAASSSRRSA